MGTPIKYLALLFARAAQKSILLTDRLTIMIIPFATLVLWLTGAKMTDTLQETVYLGVAITVLAVVILRLTAASYFVWKDDQAEKTKLLAEINSDAFKEMQVLTDHRLSLRKELADCLAWLVTFAEHCSSAAHLEHLYRNDGTDYFKKYARSREIISQLSYDVILRVVSINLMELCEKIIKAANEGVNNHKLKDRLWAQRKLTFKLLHRQDIHEVITLAQVEILIAEFGENFDSKQPASESVKVAQQTMQDLKNLLIDDADTIGANEHKLRSLLRGIDK